MDIKQELNKGRGKKKIKKVNGRKNESSRKKTKNSEEKKEQGRR